MELYPCKYCNKTPYMDQSYSRYMIHHICHETRVSWSSRQHVVAEWNAKNKPKKIEDKPKLGIERIKSEDNGKTLKNCPLCGHEAGFSELETLPGRVSHTVLCLDNHCCCSTGEFSLKKDAIKAWNKRPVLI